MIPVFYGANRGIYKGLLLATMSLAKYSDEELNVYVLTMDLTSDNPKFQDISDEQIDLLTKVLQAKNPKSKAIKLDVTEMYKTYMIDGANHHTGYTPYTLLRLMIDMMPDLPDKAIYLDVDTMACSDIKELFDQDVEGYDVGMVKDFMGRFWIHHNYCNAGMLLMNIKQIKEDGMFRKCRELVYRKKMAFSDQTAINKYAKIKHLPFKFNEQRKIHKDTVVKHFCKGAHFYLPFWINVFNIKQWEFDKVHKKLKIHNFDDIFEEFEKLKTQYDFI